MKKTLILTASLAALISVQSAHAQVLFTGTYAQNFTSMGTGTTTPTGWTVVSESGSHNTFAPAGSSTVGVAPNFTAGTLTTGTQTVVHVAPAQADNTNKGAGAYNYTNSAANIAAGEGTESLGTSPSGNSATILELSLKNNTGSAITAINVSYDIDRFTTISNTNGSASGFPNTGVEEYPGYQLFYNLTPSNTGTWTNVSALNPTIDMGTTGPVQVPNTVGITQVSSGPNGITFTGNWTAGSTIALAWFDDNAESPSPDQVIGLNNVQVAVAPEPSSLALFTFGGALMAFVLIRRRKI